MTIVRIQLAVTMQVAAARKMLILKIPQEPLQAANAEMSDVLIGTNAEMIDVLIGTNAETNAEINKKRKGSVLMSNTPLKLPYTFKEYYKGNEN